VISLVKTPRSTGRRTAGSREHGRGHDRLSEQRSSSGTNAILVDRRPIEDFVVPARRTRGPSPERDNPHWKAYPRP
jgi:hypothetical protein